MTDSNVPEVIPTRELAPVAEVDTDSWTAMAASVVKLAETIADTPFVPKGLRGSIPATAAAMLYGREIGLPPMTSLQSVYVVEGKPTVSAERMRAMVLAAGHELEVLEATGAICRMRGRRRGSDTWTEIAWTVDMARAANLTHKDNWKHYPRAMLIARTTTDLCRMIFPDVIAGFRSTEEWEDVAGADTSTPSAPATQAEPARRVRRTRKTATAPAGQPPALEAPAERPPAPAGPPLPGEAGYEETPAGDDAPSGDVASAGEPSPSLAGPSSEEEPPTSGEAPEDSSSDETDPEPDDPGAPVNSQPGRKASRAQTRMLLAMLSGLGVAAGDREERLLVTGTLLGRPLATYDDLTAGDAHHLIDTLGPLEGDRAKLDAVLDGLPAMPPPAAED